MQNLDPQILEVTNEVIEIDWEIEPTIECGRCPREE